MLRPRRGSWNQALVKVSGTLIIADLAEGETSDVERIDFGTYYETLNGDAGIEEDGVVLADPGPVLGLYVAGYTTEILGQDTRGFWVRVGHDVDGGGQDYYYGGSETDYVGTWEVRGVLA